MTKVTPETLTDEMIREWESHELCSGTDADRCRAVDLATIALSRAVSARDFEHFAVLLARDHNRKRVEARRHICAAINARKGARR